MLCFNLKIKNSRQDVHPTLVFLFYFFIDFSALIHLIFNWFLKDRTDYHSSDETLGLTPSLSAVFNFAFFTIFSHYEPFQTPLVSLLK